MEVAVGIGAGDLLHEPEEVRGRMAGAERVRHFAGGDLQGREQIEDAVSPIVVRVAHGAAGAQREGRLRALQRLNRGLLVDTEHNRVLGRVEVEPDDIGDLGGKGRIPAHFVGAHEMRLQAVRAQDVGDAATGAADRVGQQPGRPPAAPGRRRRQRQLHDLLDGVGGHRVVAAARFRLVEQPVDARLHEPPPNPRDRFGRQVELRRDLDAADPGRTQENDARAAHHARRRRRAGDQGLQLFRCLRVCLTRCVCATHGVDHILIYINGGALGGQYIGQSSGGSSPELRLFPVENTDSDGGAAERHCCRDWEQPAIVNTVSLRGRTLMSRRLVVWESSC